MLDERWLLDNIHKVVGDGRSTLFWNDMWLDGSSLDTKFNRLFELSVNKLRLNCTFPPYLLLIIVSEMYGLGWGVDGMRGS